MSSEKKLSLDQPQRIRSLVAVIAGSMVLRCAAGAMNENLQFYFNAIHEASLSPQHPLSIIVGFNNVYPITYTLGSVILGSFFVAELIGAFWLGAWSDRLGRKWFILIGPLLGAIAVVITSLTTIFWLLIFTRLLEGLSTASNAPATLGYLAEVTSDSKKLRTRASGFFEIATIGGIAGGFSLGGWLWRELGTARLVAGIPVTSPAFAANSLVYLLSFLLLWLGIREMKQRPVFSDQPVVPIQERLKRYWQIMSGPLVLGFAPAWIAINAVLGIWFNLTARILTDKAGFTNQLLVGHFTSIQAGNLLAVFAVIFVLGILIWSVLFTNLRKTTAMLIGCAGLLLSSLLILAINNQPALNAPAVTPLAILLALSIMIQSGFTPAALAHLADITESYTADRGAIMGLYSVFLGLGQFLGAIIGGIFVDWRGANGMALIMGLLGIFAAVMVSRLRKAERT